MKTSKTAILAAARDIFLERGLAAVTMREVAFRTGVSATAIYRHYHDKKELMSDVVGEGYALLVRYFFTALEGKTPLERLALTGERYLDFAFTESRYYKIIFMSGDLLEPAGPQAGHAASHGPSFQFLIDRVAECRRQGLIRGERDDFSVALHLWAQCHGLAALYLSGGIAPLMPLDRYRALCRASLEMILGTLRP